MRKGLSNSFAAAAVAACSLTIWYLLRANFDHPPPVGWFGFVVFTLPASFLFFYILSLTTVPIVSAAAKHLPKHKSLGAFLVSGAALGFILSRLAVQFAGIKNGGSFDYSSHPDAQMLVLSSTVIGTLAAIGAWTNDIVNRSNKNDSEQL